MTGLQFLANTEVLRQNQMCGPYIQGDSGGKVNILGMIVSVIVRKKSLYEHVPNSEWLQR